MDFATMYGLDPRKVSRLVSQNAGKEVYMYNSKSEFLYNLSKGTRERVSSIPSHLYSDDSCVLYVE